MSRGNRLLLVPVVLATALLASQGAYAWPSCTDIFAATYPDSATENNGGCQTCHQSAGGGGNFNVYGSDLLSNGGSGAGPACTSVNFAEVLAAVESLDSDGEGNSNRAEIDANTQPGWCDESQSAGCSNSAGTPPNVPLDPEAAAPANNPPLADAGGPYAGEAGTTLIQFDGSGSEDPDGDEIGFAWNFGDGNTATGMMPTHTYAQAGDYEVSLVVDDGRAESEPSVTSAAITAPAVNIAPIADPGGPYSAEPGQAIAFDGSASADPNGDPLTYSWDFGDGSTGTGPTPTHSYEAAGVYEVSLVVSDGELVSDPAAARVEVVDPIAGQPEGAALYASNCAVCHGDPWEGPAVDDTLPGLKRVAGARSCNIAGSIFGTSVFPNGVPSMQFLQGLSDGDIESMADYLNSRDATGEQRYVTTCAGCHGNDGSGGRVGEDVHGDSAGETWEAIVEEEEMNYLACMPRTDIDAIVDFLAGRDNDNDDDGINDDDDADDDNDGVNDDDEREDGTDPRDKDTDDDGLDDGEERDHGTDPNDPDSDDDGRSDGEEVNVLGTNPLLADSTTGADDSSGGGTTGLPLLLALLVFVRRRLYR